MWRPRAKLKKILKSAKSKYPGTEFSSELVKLQEIRGNSVTVTPLTLPQDSYGLNKQNETRFDNRSCYFLERDDYYYDRWEIVKRSYHYDGFIPDVRLGLLRLLTGLHRLILFV